MSERSISPEGLVLFEAVFSPWKGKDAKPDAKPRYTLALAFAPNADLAQLKALVKDCAVAKWGQTLPRKLRSPFIDYENYEHELFKPGMILIRPNSIQRPGVVDARVQPIIEPADFYAGCYARVSVHAYAYDTPENKGVSLGLDNVQKLRDGDPIGRTRSKPEDDFGAPTGGGGSSRSADDVFG